MTKQDYQKRAEKFYSESLKILKESKIPFMLAGTFSLSALTGIVRATKDMDIFCKPSDFPKILELFQDRGYKVEIYDERWIGKIHDGDVFFDVIFGHAHGAFSISDAWFKGAKYSEFFGTKVLIIPPTEAVASRLFVANRNRYDGNDAAHIILKQHQNIDWNKLLSYFEKYWEILLIHVLNFRFIYPSERDNIPKWLLDELLSRLNSQIKLPSSDMKICRGRLVSLNDFHIDVKEWGFADIVGMANEQSTQTSVKGSNIEFKKEKH